MILDLGMSLYVERFLCEGTLTLAGIFFGQTHWKCIG